MEDSGVKIFDPNGDVRLLVFDHSSGQPVQKTFLVNSRALSHASEIWKAIFSGHFRESSRGRDEGIEFPDDDPKALGTLLSIAHLRFHEVPRQSDMTFKHLLEVTHLTDKYGATHLLIPWFQGWLESARQYLNKTGYEEWLWIAWELGQTQIFDSLCRHLVRSTRVDYDERLSNKSGWILYPDLDDEFYFPPDIMGTSTHHLRPVCLADYFQKESSKCDRPSFFQSVPYTNKSSESWSLLAAVVRQDAG